VCRGVLNTCDISGANARTLTRQLRVGTRLAIQVITLRETLDGDYGTDGFVAALTEAQAKAGSARSTPKQ